MKYLFANWKMYLGYEESLALAEEIASQKNTPTNVTMAIFPSALSAVEVTKILRQAGVATGAQNVHWLDKGGYTGEVSAQMYKAISCQYALVGHSERRHVSHETNHEVRQKVEAVISAGMTPVICVGETETERNDNKTAEVIETQIRSAFHNIIWPKGKEIILAYEPVWAITKGDISIPCDPIEAERIHEMIKKQVLALIGVTATVLYGGSVQADNINEYLRNPNIDGALVGAASVKLESWVEILRAIK